MFGIADNHEFLSAIGIEKAPNRDELVASLEELAAQKFTIKLAGRLNTEQLEEFNAIEDEKQAADWLNAHVPDFQSLVTEALAEMRDEILTMRATVLG